MNTSMTFYYLIAGLSIINLLRVLSMLIGSDIYDICQILKGKTKKRAYRPLITVIIPAYNEEVVIVRTIESVLANGYANKQVIVVNDGSKDNTARLVRNFQRRHPGLVTLVNQKNAGKAAAINRAIRHWAKGSLVMVVDADSILSPTAISNMVEHFRDRKVIAAAANVKVLPSNKTLGLVQRFEYLISYRMKRALTIFNMEYIIGGVGSTFRRSALLKVGLYDTDTMTEDIDLTVKCIKHFGNKKYRVHYAADAVAHTEHVLTFKSLVRQRFRWKFGRMQTFYKNRDLLFSRSKRHDKRLTWYQMPYAMFSELVLLIEPILIGYILWVSISFADVTSLISVYCIVTAFVSLVVLGEGTESWHEKLKLAVILPFLYLWLYILTLVEFLALIQSIRKSREITRPEQSVSWEHVERLGNAL